MYQFDDIILSRMEYGLFTTAFTFVFIYCRDFFQAVHSNLSTFLRNRVVHPLALFPADHKSAVAEYLHMVRERWLTQMQILKKMTGT
jgi:hypothetical protein